MAQKINFLKGVFHFSIFGPFFLQLGAVFLLVFPYGFPFRFSFFSTFPPFGRFPCQTGPGIIPNIDQHPPSQPHGPPEPNVLKTTLLIRAKNVPEINFGQKWEEKKKPINIKKFGGTPPLLDRSHPVDVSRLSHWKRPVCPADMLSNLCGITQIRS